MNRLKLLIICFAMAVFLAIDANAQFGKKDKEEQPQEQEEAGGGLGGKLKSKVKNFNPMKSLGKLAGNMMTSTTADLSEVSMQVLYMQNIYPSEAGTTETEYFGFWESGSDMAGVMFQKREGVGFFKIDGTVNLDGAPIEHVANGFYGGIVKKNSGSHSFEIETVNGDKVSLAAEPIEPIEIVSVNGIPKGEPIVINMDEDLVLELNHPQGGTADFYVSVLGKVMGVKGFNDLGYFKSAHKVVVPKEAFMHTATPAMKFEQENNYLMVMRAKESVVQMPGVGAVQIVSGASDWTPITFTGKGKTILGIGMDEGMAQYKAETEEGFQVLTNKPNAFWGPPLSRPKKLAVASFVVRATELQQSQSKTTTSYGYNSKTVTTTTTTKTFPEVPEAYWDQLMEELYQKFETALLAEMDVELVPIEVVMKAQNYQNMFSVEDTVSKSVVVKPYKGCKLLLPTTLRETFENLSTTFPSDRPEIKLQNELGVDGIIAVTVDCAMAWEDGALSPRFAFKITGPTNGWKVGPTIYASGLVTGPGKGISQTAASADGVVDQLHQIMSVDEVISLFRQGIAGLKHAETEKGHERIWALK